MPHPTLTRCAGLSLPANGEGLGGGVKGENPSALRKLPHPTLTRLQRVCPFP
jgi:hypothetical protein